MNSKMDLKKSIDSYKAKHNQFRILTLPTHQYLMVDGHGDPNTSQEFVDAIEALYPVAYRLKFASKINLGKDYVVPPLEGLWWAKDMQAYTIGDKSNWDWTLMILTPDWITKDMFDVAMQSVLVKSTPVSLSKLRLETLDEGLCVQTLHIGSYASETDIINKMHSEFIPANGLNLTGKHHEIYLSDMRKVAPEKLRTIIRQPVTKT